eukprot:1160062-Pelagomonas_calceolata.AAC.11
MPGVRLSSLHALQHCVRLLSLRMCVCLCSAWGHALETAHARHHDPGTRQGLRCVQCTRLVRGEPQGDARARAAQSALPPSSFFFHFFAWCKKGRPILTAIEKLQRQETSPCINYETWHIGSKEPRVPSTTAVDVWALQDSAFVCMYVSI